MLDNILVTKCECIERCVRQARQYYRSPSLEPFESDYLKQDAIAANIHKAVEQSVLMANHVVKMKKIGDASRCPECLELLVQGKIIPLEMKKNLMSLISFRNNLLYHDSRVDIVKFRDIIENSLSELSSFTRTVMDSIGERELHHGSLD